uniref:Caveolin n=1 Tax=Oryzias latipes TaxID=8090 RepID=A0A3B3INR7_ORYLA
MGVSNKATSSCGSSTEGLLWKSLRVDLLSEDMDFTQHDEMSPIHSRDPKTINSNLKITDHHFDRVWVWSHALFEVSRLVIMPCLQLLHIYMHWIKAVWASILNSVISPFFSSFGKCNVICSVLSLVWFSS